MKNTYIIYILLALVAGAVLGLFIYRYKATPDITKSLQDNTNTGSLQRSGGGRGNRGQGQGRFNRGNCLGDECLEVDNLEYPAGQLTSEVKNALDEAIDDEYKAMSTYQAVIDKFGQVRPFSMIIGAELQHIASLTNIYQKYGLKVPENSWTGKVTVPSTLQAACQTGVDAEIANADLYKNNLLPIVADYEDITSVFTNLMNASQTKHLPAFDRCN